MYTVENLTSRRCRNTPCVLVIFVPEGLASAPSAAIGHDAVWKVGNRRGGTREVEGNDFRVVWRMSLVVGSRELTPKPK